MTAYGVSVLSKKKIRITAVYFHLYLSSEVSGWLQQPCLDYARIRIKPTLSIVYIIYLPLQHRKHVLTRTYFIVVLASSASALASYV
jgi:hypothetical protein